MLRFVSEPRGPTCKRLRGAELCRLRIDSYRIIYGIPDEALIIFVLDVMDRGSDYESPETLVYRWRRFSKESQYDLRVTYRFPQPSARGRLGEAPRPLTQMLIPIEEILAARERLAPYLPPTPLKQADSYSERLGAKVLLKLELFQPTGAFKVRGALNALLSLSEGARERGVIASSAGNHGLGLAFAATTLGSPATVVLPASAPARRARLIERLGARVIVHGEDWNAANARALQLTEQQGLTYVSPFDDPAIMAGQGTIALELLEQVPDLDVVVCSVGGGGLISGIASALRALRPEVRVIGVETEGADCMARSLAAGRIVELERFSSIATSLGTKRTQDRPFGIVREAVERVEVVPDVRALEELLQLLDEEKLLVEPAASCTLAALVDGQVPDVAGAVIAPVMCGANVTLSQVLGWRESLLGQAVG